MVSISKEVYSPSEDSWLLEECILKENLVGKKCLDLGTGLGIQSIAMLKSGASAVLAVNINPLA
ncbi:MAG: 50S ribosomal protein L11 methyltransferase, partial [archaeon]